ncbi:ABC transporter permease [Streptomyces sp. VRA16 Mangrove soil]|uniref:ABC transporter permease n=1 Tax=Streptomyces sp. VRA16 Mangrove soil TaxID=2817434 RepID=UPI001A9D6287|nr:ABC transporter permease [Streptomyces sp. VRA16 Mangrove soil]MBO1337237.1 ABC transporter permease [Streptomyces sp. VRA16 Mangrove soil]
MSETIAAVGAEFIKVRAIRATFLALLLFAPLSVAIAALDGWSAKSAIESDNGMLRDGFTAQQAGLDGILYGQLALIVFGVLVFASEYGSGMMRVSLLAVPRRGLLYAAKLTVTAAAALLVAVPVTVVGYLVTQAALGPHGASIGDAGVPRALAGAVLYLTLMSLFAAGVAAAARSAVLPLAIMLPMVLAGSQILSVIGATKELARYFPDRAGTQMLTVDTDHAVRGCVVLLVWTAAALALGYVRHRRWDA